MVKKFKKMILNKSHSKLGKAGSTILTPVGYSTYLQVKKIALPYSEEIEQEIKRNRDNILKQQRIEIDKLGNLLNSKEEKHPNITIHRNASTIGILYGSVTKKNISDAINEKYGDNNIIVHKNQITTNIIKKVGNYSVNIMIYGEVFLVNLVVALTKENI